MIVVHIDSKQGDIEKFNKYIQQRKQIFVLFYMEGCGPCNATRPEWKKIENVLQNKYKNNNNIVIADIDQELLSKIPLLKNKPSGFPTMIYISDKGDTSEDYEESNIDIKDRTIDSFIKWIETKVSQNGGFNKKKTRKTNKNMRLNKKTRKWSQKYKKSINCRTPKGFSQKQYCKYGRKTHNK